MYQDYYYASSFGRLSSCTLQDLHAVILFPSSFDMPCGNVPLAAKSPRGCQRLRQRIYCILRRRLGMHTQSAKQVEIASPWLL